MLSEKLMETLDGIQSSIRLEPEKKVAYISTCNSALHRRYRFGGFGPDCCCTL